MMATNVLNIMSAAAIEEHATAEDPTAHTYFKTNPLGSTAYMLTQVDAGRRVGAGAQPELLEQGGAEERRCPEPDDPDGRRSGSAC